jgi:hypothetical protein
VGVEGHRWTVPEVTAGQVFEVFCWGGPFASLWGASNVFTAAPERRQRILHDVIWNENLHLAQFTLVEVGIDPGGVDS